jgi:arsenate reductase (glutaredoxin)
MSVIVYGIKNCDTVKKALTWLDKNKIPYTFHDYKTKGITEAKLKSWIGQVGWESLVNKKGMTWRQLDNAAMESVTSSAAAVSLMMEKTSVIKRPLIEINGKAEILGFEEKEYLQLKGMK